jgi:hypothetical protein
MPHFFGHLDAALLESRVDAFRLFGTEARGLQDNDPRRDVPMVRSVCRDRLRD